MKLHILNCGTLCPAMPQRLLYGRGSLTQAGRIPCHCFLLELKDRLVLIDTGLGCRDIASPYLRLGALTHWALRPALKIEETALHQVQRLGYKPEDVRDIVVTHLDPDHAGGLRDFPHARVHVHEQEFKVAVGQSPSLIRYKSQQWAHACSWVRYDQWGEDWKGFRCVKGLRGIKEELFLVPLEGHSPGSMGLAFLWQGQWVFHVGDAIFQREELTDRCPQSFMQAFAWQNAFADKQRIANRQRLQQLHQEGHVHIICSHDQIPDGLTL